MKIENGKLKIRSIEFELKIENGKLKIRPIEFKLKIMQGKDNPILDKSKLFALRIIKLYRYLKEDKDEYVISQQLLRSGTSIGANVRESKNAASKADFINKLVIALKEADESQYWLELLYESEYITQIQYDSVYEDCRELVALLTSIIKSSKNMGT